MSINFGGWPAEMHTDCEQVKRIESAKKLKKDVVSMDPVKQIIYIKGSASEPYQATLRECTCTDFSFRQAPCKHMYCLAFALGLMDGLPVYDKKTSTYDPEAELNKYRDLYESGQISADVYVKVGSVLSKMKK
jgi:hypothetical protein